MRRSVMWIFSQDMKCKSIFFVAEYISWASCIEMDFVCSVLIHVFSNSHKDEYCSVVYLSS